MIGSLLESLFAIVARRQHCRGCKSLKVSLNNQHPVAVARSLRRIADDIARRSGKPFLVCWFVVWMATVVGLFTKEPLQPRPRSGGKLQFTPAWQSRTKKVELPPGPIWNPATSSTLDSSTRSAR